MARRQFKILKDDPNNRYKAGERGALLSINSDGLFSLSLERGLDGVAAFARHYSFKESEVEEIFPHANFKNRCRFNVFIYNKIIVLFDLYDDASPTMTLTNGMEEAVLAVLNKVPKKGRPIIYRDSEGNYDEVKFSSRANYGNKVLGFTALNTKNLEEAIDKSLGSKITFQSQLTFEEMNNDTVDINAS